jgi:hypothetical protein
LNRFSARSSWLACSTRQHINTSTQGALRLHRTLDAKST